MARPIRWHSVISVTQADKLFLASGQTRVAHRSNGDTLHAIWATASSATATGASAVYHGVYTTSWSWSSLPLYNSGDRARVSSPSLAGVPGGKWMVAAWIETTGNLKTQLVASIWSGSSWSSPTLLDTGGTSKPLLGFSLDAYQSDGAVIAWWDQSGRVQVATTALSTGTWTLNDPGITGGSVSVDGRLGSIVFAWESGSTVDASVGAKTFPLSGSHPCIVRRPEDGHIFVAFDKNSHVCSATTTPPR